MIGIDEVGRGAWAGPLVVGAVDLIVPIDGLADSKVLSAHKRNDLAQQIIAHNPYGLGWVSADEIDDIGLSAALYLAASRALQELTKTTEPIIVDGTISFYPLLTNVTTLIKADTVIPAVSAASIVAKVARDTRMQQLGVQYPGYGFEKHVGYGTAYHTAKLQELGASPLHRLSFKLPCKECYK